MQDLIIRDLASSEIYLLRNFLYESIWQPEGAEPYPKSVVDIPEVHSYIKDFGQESNDYCLVAEHKGEVVGAVWGRIISGDIKGYGYIDSNTPEFVISVLKDYRGKGIGTKLMNEMVYLLNKEQYSQTSLSVQKGNRALNLYRKMGFNIVDENDNDYIMLLKF